MLNNPQRVLVTGATGFVGRHLCHYLLEQGWKVLGVGRDDKSPITHSRFEYQQIQAIENMEATKDWLPLLEGVQVVVHLAARVHHTQERGMQALKAYQATNVKGTQQLAHAAVKSDVKRFVYISTIKVNGEKTHTMAFRAEDQPQPQDAYSLSKLQAEQILQEESRRSGMEWVIVRPPLIYGPQVKGNFKLLVELARSYIPLPFLTVKNLRSFVSVQNLSSFIACCLNHPHARGEVFLVSDGEDVSTPELIRVLRRAQGRRRGLFPFPLFVLKLAGFLTGRSRQIERLLGSLQVNIEKSCRLLHWKPTGSVEENVKALYNAPL